VRSSILVANNLILENRTAGIFCRYDGPSPVTVVNNTILGNHNEAGINVWHGASAVVVNNIITANTGYGGVYCDSGGTVTLVKNNIWANSSFSDPSIDYVGCEAGETDISADPLFTDPGNADFSLMVGSPCIDAGTSEGAPVFDIQGGGRPCGNAVDIGAYEMGNCPPPMAYLRGDSNADGKQNITDAVSVLGYLFTNGDTPSCLKAADTNDTGDIDLTDAVYLLNYLFLGGQAPKPPFPTCGLDLTIDELTCESYPPCD